MFSTFTTPKANRGKLQRPLAKAPARATPSGGFLPTSPPPLSPTSARQSITEVSPATRTGNLTTRIPLLKPTVRRDAPKSQTSIGESRRGVVIMDDIFAAKPVGDRAHNVSDHDSGVVMSPPSSPEQPSQAAVECPANTRVSSTAPGKSPSSERPGQITVACDDNLKQSDGTATKDNPTRPTGQRQKRKLPCPSRNPAMQTILTSSSPSSGGIFPTVAASYLFMLPPTPGQPLRTSTYPIPMVSSPLLDNSILLRPNSPSPHNSLSGSISTGSSSSSFQRLLRRGSQKLNSNRRSLYPPRTTEEVSSPRPSSGDQIDYLSSLPYETLPATGPPPTFVGKPVTPRVIAHATTPVTALPGVAESASICSQSTRDKKGKQRGGGLWSFFSRNPAKSDAKRGSSESRQRTFSQQCTLTNEDANSSCCGQNNRCARCSDLKTQRSNYYQPARGQPQQLTDWERYATKPLPHPPLPSRLPGLTNKQLPNGTGELEQGEDDRDPIATQRHRRRALFALDGLTYCGSNTSRRAPPPPPPPSKSSTIIHGSPQRRVKDVHITSPTAAHSRTLHPGPPRSAIPTTQSRMSDEVKLAFIRRGREAESRVFSAHICTEAKDRMAVTGEAVFPSSGDQSIGSASRPQMVREMNANINERGLERQSPAETEHAYFAGVAGNTDQGTGEQEIDASLIMKGQARKDVAWWEDAQEGATQVKASAKLKRSAPSPTKVRHSIRQESIKETLLEDAVRDLEFAAETASRRENGDAEAEPTWFLPLAHEDAVPTTSKRNAPPTPAPSQQVSRDASSPPSSQRLRSNEQKQSFLRGRQLARDTFRKHRDAGRWDRAADYEQKSLGQDISSLSGDPLQRQPQIMVQIPWRAWDEDVSPASSAEEVVNDARIALTTTSVAGNGISPHPGSAGGSTSSSSASLNATVFRVFKDKKDKKHKAAKPPLDAYEAAHAVQSNSNAELTPSSSHGSHGSSSLDRAQRRDMQPEPLSLRSQDSRMPPATAAEAVPLVGLGIDTGASGQHELLNCKDINWESELKEQRRRPPPPPAPLCTPVRTPQASYLPLPFRAVSSAAARQQTPHPKRRPTPSPPPPRTASSPQQPATPPIPLRSAGRLPLGGDWSSQDLEKIKHGVLINAQTSQRRDLSPVAEDGRDFSDRRMQGGKNQQQGESAKKVSWDRHGEESDYGSEADEDEDRFWSDDEDGARRGGGSSKKTTPEKDGVWVPPFERESGGGKGKGKGKFLGEVDSDGDGDGDGSHRGGTFDDSESQLLGYYFDAQREEEERDLRASREAAREGEVKARAAAEAEEARRREDEARASRVAELMARVRAGVMD